MLQWYPPRRTQTLARVTKSYPKYTIAILAVLAVPHFAFGEEEDKDVERDEKSEK